jgi:hypothetical protein
MAFYVRPGGFIFEVCEVKNKILKIVTFYAIELWVMG